MAKEIEDLSQPSVRAGQLPVGSVETTDVVSVARTKERVADSFRDGILQDIVC